MRRRIIFIVSVAVVGIALIAACQSGGGGGSERFSTVEIFASYDEGTYEADAQERADVDGDGFCDVAFTFADTVTATVTSTAYDPLPGDLDPCNVNILRYKLEYFPQTGAAVPVRPRTINHSISIPAPASPGSVVEKEIPIEIFTNNDKQNDINPVYFASGEAEFPYNIKVTLTMEEVCTRIQEKVQFWIPVRYFDIATDTCS
jgi:hypothetical protein